MILDGDCTWWWNVKVERIQLMSKGWKGWRLTLGFWGSMVKTEWYSVWRRLRRMRRYVYYIYKFRILLSFIVAFCISTCLFSSNGYFFHGLHRKVKYKHTYHCCDMLWYHHVLNNHRLRSGFPNDQMGKKCHQTHAVLFIHPNETLEIHSSQIKMSFCFLIMFPQSFQHSKQFCLWTGSWDTPDLVGNGKRQWVMSQRMTIILVIWLQVLDWNGRNFQEEWSRGGFSFLDMEAKQSLKKQKVVISSKKKSHCFCGIVLLEAEEFSDQMRSSWQATTFNQTQSTLHITSS